MRHGAAASLSAQHFWCGPAVFQLAEVVYSAGSRQKVRAAAEHTHASQRQQAPGLYALP